MKSPLNPQAAHLFCASVLVLGLGLSSGRVRAQSISHQTAGVALGLRGDAIRDDLLVPLAFAGPGVELQGFYRGWVGPGVMKARADIAFAYLWNRSGDEASTLAYGADVTWTFNVLYAETWHFEVGPTLVFDNRSNFIFSWDNAHIYWLDDQWLGPAARYQRRLGDTWRFEGSASMALLGLQGRPPSYRYNKQETSGDGSYFFTRPVRSEKFVLLDDLQVLRIDVAARHAAYNRFDVGRGWAFGMEFRMARTGIPDTNINLSLCAYVSRAWGWR